jgi:repressor LexA
MSRSITNRQIEALKAIANYHAENGYAPSIRDLMAAMGITSLRGVVVHLDALQRKGLIARQPAIGRSTTLTEAGRNAIS